MGLKFVNLRFVCLCWFHLLVHCDNRGRFEFKHFFLFTHTRPVNRCPGAFRVVIVQCLYVNNQDMLKHNYY